MDEVDTLRDKLGHLLVFHYSTTGRSQNPQMITGIVVRDYATNEFWSFSSERLQSEDKILAEFIQLLQQKNGYALAGWNWGGAVYGTTHVEERLKANGLQLSILGFPAVDIAKIVKAKYGEQYVKDPKLRNLARANRIPMQGFVDGAMEPILFANRKFARLEKSTHKKVEILSSIISRILDNSLTLTPVSMLALIEAHPFGVFLQFEAVTVVYSYIGAILLSLLAPVVFSLPLEFIYATTAMSSLLLLFNDLFLALRRGDIGRLIQSTFVLLLEAIILMTALISSLALFPNVVAEVDLTSLDTGSKVAIALASFAPIFVTIRPLKNVSLVVVGTLRRIWRDIRQ